MITPDMKEHYARLGKSIERAAGELPDRYQVVIEVELGAATVWLWIPPPAGEKFGERIDELNGDHPAEKIASAVKVAAAHYEQEKGR